MNTDLAGADGLREHNARLDLEITELVDVLTDYHLGSRPDPDEWTLAENLAHMAEFPRYFARQLDEWLDSGRTLMGRVAEHSADRNDAIARAADLTMHRFREDILASFALLAAVLGRLTDDDLDRTVRNVKYGDEPLTSYLSRYMLGHKQAHLAQLRRTAEAARLTPEPFDR